MWQRMVLSAGLVALLSTAPEIAQAYIGPGAGITAIGTVIALIGAVLLAIVGFVWYPVKRLRARLRDRKQAERDEQGSRAA